MTASKLTALVVEDDPKLQKCMIAHLRQMDFEVLVAGHYDAAIMHLGAFEPHIACIDVGLPDKSGYELCEHIRGLLRFVALPIIITSDYGDAGDMAHAENAGGNAFLHKPFSMPELARCIDSLLSVSRKPPPLRFPLQVRGPASMRAL